MKTQIVYVLISSEEDYFLEELWVSVYSLRHFHPEERVIVMTDEPTAKRINKLPEMANLFTEIVVVDVPEEYNNRFRSRIIKTNLRNLIDGDFLFIDTDTVICDSLEGVDNLDIKNVAMVPELHGPFKNHITYDMVCSEMDRIFNIDVSKSKYWFNSGCMLVKDNQLVRDFFKKWCYTWKRAVQLKNAWTDQKSLFKVDFDNSIIELLPDDYNCQVALSIKHLHTARILHFWHMRKAFGCEGDFSPFLSKDIYRDVRRDNGISLASSEIIQAAKTSFTPLSMIVGRDEQHMLFSPFYTFLWKTCKEDRVIRFLVDILIKVSILRTRIKDKMYKNKKDERW